MDIYDVYDIFMGVGSFLRYWAVQGCAVQGCAAGILRLFVGTCHCAICHVSFFKKYN